ncbi:Tn3 family transposase [Marinicella sediminis]|uniref:Tn3 family transposase n=1 Tax=Marinicella sediminis TaxID=1792834 RepID=A0ABV7J5A8_9GAMM|nr:Tn3 family transposase [Marinicella sediminis]
MSSPKILSKSRERAFKEVPKFSKPARNTLIAVNYKNQPIIHKLKSDINKLGFLMQWAYFGSRGMFFDSNKLQSRPKDIKKAHKELRLSKTLDLNDYAFETAVKHREMILDAYGWSKYTKDDETILKSHALIQVDHVKSKTEAFKALYDFCWESRIEIPGYNKLASIVNDSFLKYETQIMERFDQNVSVNQKRVLTDLLEQNDVTDSFTELKKINQGETKTKLNKNADILNLFKTSFIEIKPLLDGLDLSTKGIKNFADWIYTSDLNQIKRLKNKTKLKLHLSAFIQDQFFLRQDASVDATLKKLRYETNQAKSYQRNKIESNEQESIESGQAVALTAVSTREVLRRCGEILNDQTYMEAERNEKARHLIESYFISEDPDFEDNVLLFQNDLSDIENRQKYYEYLFAASDRVQKSITPFIRTLMFDEDHSCPLLISAINKFALDTNNKDFEKEFFTKYDHINFDLDDGIPKITKYKIILFTHIEQAIRNKNLTLKYSYKYRHINSYLISDKDWETKKETLLKSARLDKFINGEEILQSMGKILTESYEKVNKRFLDGENEDLKVNANGNWKLKDPDAAFDSSKFIPGLLTDAKYKLLYELITEVDSYTDFSSAFKHSSNKHANKSIDKKLLYATLMSLGNNYGHHTMAKSSKGISSKNLSDTDLKWFSAENVEKANEIVVKFIQKLSMPTLYNNKNGIIHTSSDGKKIVVAVESLLANYSYKYFDKEQGINVNSSVDEQQRFYHYNILTSSDREAPYMMDSIVSSEASLFREGEKIKGRVHSTDTHGYTEAIFAGLHFLNVSFAPRIKNIHKQAIYGFEAKSLQKNTTNPIAPKTAINKKLILKNWDSILRLMATIKLRVNTASQIFRILSSSSPDNELYKALKEFGRLIKSNFILNYIDNKPLRVSIQKQLNRVELGQKLSGAVFHARKGKLYVGTPDEMQKVVGCTTLIKNLIICWNYLFLSDYYSKLNSKEDKEMVIESIRKGSVIAWDHINMIGQFDFDQAVPGSFTTTVREMMKLKIYD